ncbi:hypothetical protein [Synechococcus sp. CC9616]|uniref:hypothetical protein n=1 Tax=Synechococcus sp. CC9616 TaxID=110663 RepID=UPI0004B238EF|nr:hypothetical protein [Synechococcus sp. CC9616]
MKLRSLIRRRFSLLTILASVVLLSVLVRPAALITFTLVALAGGLTIPTSTQR